MFYGPRDEVESKDDIGRMLDSQVEKLSLTWELAIVRRADDRLIGACDLLEDRREADLGYILPCDAWGHGYATEAAREMGRIGFDNSTSTEFLCEVSNTPSAHVFEKAGLHRECILPKYREAKGRWWDMYLYATVCIEWQQGGVSRIRAGD